MLFRLLALPLIIVGLLSYAECRGKFDDPYEYHLIAEHEIRTGHISHDAEKGARIHVEIEETEGHGEEEGASEDKYLKVLIQHAEKTLPPQKHTSAMPQANGQTTHDNTRVASNTFNKVPKSTARVQNTGSDVSPEAQILTTNALRTNTDSSAETSMTSDQTDNEVSVVTRPHTGSLSPVPHHNIHLTTGNGPTASTGNIKPHFRNIIPHGHNIHITHLTHDPVHPAINKRSVGQIFREKRKLRHRNKRNFAVPPEHFQPAPLIAQAPTKIQTATKAPPSLVVKDTNAFIVDPVDGYIRVNGTSQLIEESSPISFYVVMVDEDGNYVSNPLPFFVHVDHPAESDTYPVGAAVFAGVLVLCVVFLALFIPLVTRAKRRYKEGKPMFKMGSHPSRADLEKSAMDSQTSLPRNPSEPNWYGNNIFYNYEDEIAKDRYQFSKGLRQYSTKSEPPTLQLQKNKREAPSDSSSSSGIDSASQGANGYDGPGDSSYVQRM